MGRERGLSGHLISPGSRFFVSELVQVGLPQYREFLHAGMLPCCFSLVPSRCLVWTCSINASGIKEEVGQCFLAQVKYFWKTLIFF